jgi:hypothetical protein
MRAEQNKYRQIPMEGNSFVPNQKGAGNLMLLQNFVVLREEKNSFCGLVRQLLPKPEPLLAYRLSDDLPEFHFSNNAQASFFRYLQYSAYPFLTHLFLKNVSVGEILHDEHFSEISIDFYFPTLELAILLRAESPSGLESSFRAKGITLLFAEDAQFITPVFEAHLSKKQYAEEIQKYQQANELSDEEIFAACEKILHYRLQILLLTLLEEGKFQKRTPVLRLNVQSDVPEIRQKLLQAFEALRETGVKISKTLLPGCGFEFEAIEFSDEKEVLKIDFSLFKRPDDAPETRKDTIFVRTSVQNKEKFYYRNLNNEPVFKQVSLSVFRADFSNKHAPLPLSSANVRIYEGILRQSNPFLVSEHFSEFLPAADDLFQGKNLLCESSSATENPVFTAATLLGKPVFIFCADDSSVLSVAARLTEIAHVSAFYDGMSKDEIAFQKSQCLAWKFSAAVFSADFILRADFDASEEFLKMFENAVFVCENADSLCESSFAFQIRANFAFAKIKRIFAKNQFIGFFSERSEKVLANLREIFSTKEIYFSFSRKTFPLHLHRSDGRAYLDLLALLRKKMSEAAFSKVLIITPEAEGNKGAFLLSERLSYDLNREVLFYAEKTPPEMRLRESEFEQQKAKNIEDWLSGRKNILAAKYDFVRSAALSAPDLLCFLGMPPDENCFFFFKNSPETHVFFTPDDPQLIEQIAANAENAAKTKDLIGTAAWMKNDVLHHLAELSERFELPEEEALFAQNIVGRVLSGKPNVFSVSELDFRMFSGRVIRRNKITADAVFKLHKQGFLSRFEVAVNDIYEIFLAKKHSGRDPESVKKEVLEAFCFAHQKNRTEQVQKILRIYEQMCQKTGKVDFERIESRDFFEDLPVLLRASLNPSNDMTTVFSRFWEVVREKKFDFLAERAYGEYLLSLFPENGMLCLLLFCLNALSGLRNTEHDERDQLILSVLSGEKVFSVSLQIANTFDETNKNDFCVLLCKAYPDKIDVVYDACRDSHSLHLLLNKASLRLKMTFEQILQRP